MGKRRGKVSLVARQYLMNLLPPGGRIAVVDYTVPAHPRMCCQEAGLNLPGLETATAWPVAASFLDGMWVTALGHADAKVFTELLHFLKPGGLLLLPASSPENMGAASASTETMLCCSAGPVLCIRKNYPAAQVPQGEYTRLTLRAAFGWGKLLLRHIEEHDVELELAEICTYLLGMERVAQQLHLTRVLTPDEERQFLALVQKLRERVPLAYVTGRQGFMSLDFHVTPDVLIPRPETEFLVEAVLELCNHRPCQGLDIGTGSGCIAISILHYLPQARFIACDISAKALAVASDNARKHGVAERISFVESDLLAAFPLSAAFDVIVSNPPYISVDEYPTLMPEVHAEPKTAFLAGDGLLFYRRIFKEVPPHLKSEGFLLLEMGYRQFPAIFSLIPPNLEFMRVIKDYAGIERVLVLRKNQA